MFRIFLIRLFKNKKAKIAILLFISLLLFAIILNGKFRIMNFWDRLLSPPAFDDPYSYSGKEYGFQENEKKARNIFNRGTERFLDIILDVYGLEEPDTIFLKEPGSIDESTLYLQPMARETVYRFFNDMRNLCPEIFERSDVKSKELRGQKQDSLTRRAGDGRNKSPAIDEKNYKQMLTLLLNLDRDNFAAALSYKPDFMPAVVMREEIHRAICSSRDIASYKDKVMDYIEYKTEKDLFENTFNRKITNPEDFRKKTRENLSSNARYVQMVRSHFKQLGLSQKYSSSLLAKIQSADFLPANKDTAIAEVRAYLNLARYAGQSEILKLFQYLYTMPVTGLADNPEYATALAEIAYRGGDYLQAMNISDKVLRMFSTASRSQRKLAQRIYLLSRLQRYPE